MFTSDPALLNSIFESMPIGLDVVDENLNILQMNPYFQKIFGTDAIGKNATKCTRTTKNSVMIVR